MDYTKEKWEVVHRDDEMHMCMSVIAPKGSMGDTSNIMQLGDDPNQDKAVAIVFHQCYPFANNSEALAFDDKNKIKRLIAAAPEMMNCLKKVVKWGKDYPSSRYYDHSKIVEIAKEIDAICAEAEAIITKVEGK